VASKLGCEVVLKHRQKHQVVSRLASEWEEAAAAVMFAEIIVVEETRHDCKRVVVVDFYGQKHLQAVVEAGVYRMGFDLTRAKMTVAISLEVEDRTAAAAVVEENEMAHRELSITVEDEVGEAVQTCLYRAD
jgi:dephospho-CoA kinase